MRPESAWSMRKRLLYCCFKSRSIAINTSGSSSTVSNTGFIRIHLYFFYLLFRLLTFEVFQIVQILSCTYSILALIKVVFFSLPPQNVSYVFLLLLCVLLLPLDL